MGVWWGEKGRHPLFTGKYRVVVEGRREFPVSIGTQSAGKFSPVVLCINKKAPGPREG